MRLRETVVKALSQRLSGSGRPVTWTSTSANSDYTDADRDLYGAKLIAVKMMQLTHALATLERLSHEVGRIEPKLGRQLRMSTEAITESLPPMGTSALIDELKLSRPTILAWARAGIFGRSAADQIAKHGVVQVSLRDLLGIVTALDDWRALGAKGRPGVFVRQWLERQKTVNDARARARAIARTGADPSLAGNLEVERKRANVRPRSSAVRRPSSKPRPRGPQSSAADARERGSRAVRSRRLSPAESQ